MSRVTINRADIDAAADKGLVGETKTDALWDFFSRDKASQARREEELLKKETEVNFTTMGVIFGAVILLCPLVWLTMKDHMQTMDYWALCAFSLFYGIAFTCAAALLRHHEVKIYTPTFNFITCFLVPLCVFGLLRASVPHLKTELLYFITSGLCVLTAVILYGVYRDRLMLFLSVWAGLVFVIQGHLYYGHPESFNGLRYLVWIYGAALLVLGKGIELAQKSRHYTFWIMTVGALTFWLGSTVMFGSNHTWSFAWFVLNILLCGVSIYFKRYIFLVLGLIGICIYLFDVFVNILSTSLGIMLGISLIGVLVIIAVLCFQCFYFREGG